jgi:hypothetical protein
VRIKPEFAVDDLGAAGALVHAHPFAVIIAPTCAVPGCRACSTSTPPLRRARLSGSASAHHDRLDLDSAA